jgi:cyanate permease
MNSAGSVALPLEGQISLGALSDRVGREWVWTAGCAGFVTVALIGGGAMGPWMAGVIHDTTRSYKLAFVLAIACCVVSAMAIWIAAPRKVRLVPGRVRSGD